MAQNYFSTVASVSASTSAVTLLALNPNNVSARTVYNDSTADLYLKFGTGASTTSFTVKLPASSYYEVPGPGPYGGEITGMWSAANGAARVTEVA
jgi:hypothetical protein